MKELEGYVEHIVYRNEENGYTVLSLVDDDGQEEMCVGSFPFINEGEYIVVRGSEVFHPTYGEQIKVESYEVKEPEDMIAIQRYLASGAIKGIGGGLAKRITDKFGDKTELIEGYGYDYFPTSYIVTLTDLNLSKEVQNQILEFDNVDKITSSDTTVTTLLKIANVIKAITGTILVLLVIISIFIISNTIKLTVHARRKEISIMKYVGATNNFIRWPFIVEGIIIGVVASIISIVIVGGAYNILVEQAINASFMQTINLSLVNPKDIIVSIIFVYMLLGIGIGAIGSVISMRKYLKV